MIQRSMRAMGHKERVHLSGDGISPMAQGSAIAVVAVFPLVGVYMTACVVFPELLSPWGFLAALVLAVLFGYSQYRSAKTEWRKNTDLSEGSVEVLTVTAHRAIEVCEFEDEGVGYYLDVGKSGVLYLQGQYLSGDVTAKRFPCTQFELTRSVTTKIPLELRCSGEYLIPIHENPAFTIAEHETGLAHYDGDELDVPFESLMK